MCTAQSLARVLSSLKSSSKDKREWSGSRTAGALSSTCNAAAEIFRIAAIVNGLFLIGAAIGFVLSE